MESKQEKRVSEQSKAQSPAREGTKAGAGSFGDLRSSPSPKRPRIFNRLATSAEIIRLNRKLRKSGAKPLSFRSSLRMVKELREGNKAKPGQSPADATADDLAKLK